LSRAVIEQAALALVDRDGLGALSLRTVAVDLGVTPMALYRHVAGKNDLLAAIAEARLAAVATPPVGTGWRELLVWASSTLRAVLRAEPDLLELFTHQPVTTPAARARVAGTLAVLCDAGFDEARAADAFAAVHTYTIGFCALENARQRGSGHSVPTDADPISDLIAGFVTERRFRVGLDAMLAGLGSP
jgi:AcrR family transcriptional regulator